MSNNKKSNMPRVTFPCWRCGKFVTTFDLINAGGRTFAVCKNGCDND